MSIMLVSSYFIYKNDTEDKNQEETFEEIRKIVEENKLETEKNEINIDELYKINNDIVGWIRIDNTSIDYPVMQTRDRPNFYLRKNFYKQYSYWGTPYLAENCDIEKSDNLIIYAHHINGSKMFGEIEKYKRKEFYQNHKYIDFCTMEQKMKYEVIAVFKTTVNSGFQYYNFINASGENEFDTFVNKCKGISLYKIEQKVQYGDKLLTMSTCDYSLKGGRFVVVARKL